MEVTKNLVSSGSNIMDPNVHRTAVTMADIFAGQNTVPQEPVPQEPVNQPICTQEPTPVENVVNEQLRIPVPNFLKSSEDSRITVTKKRSFDEEELTPTYSRKHPGEDTEHYVEYYKNVGAFRCENPHCRGDPKTHSTKACGRGRDKNPCTNCLTLLDQAWYNHTEDECNVKRRERCKFCLQRGYRNIVHTQDQCRILKAKKK
jgi:hypothetical protein